MRYYLLIASFVHFATMAQVPGYMGKRFSFFLEANPTPALLAQNANNTVVADVAEEAQTDKVKIFAFTLRPTVTLEYLIHRDVSIGFSYSRIKIGTARAYLLGPETNSYTKSYSLDPDVLKGESAGVHAKFFKFKKSGSIAPIGFYQTVSAYVTRTNTYDTKKSTAKQFKYDFIYPVAAIGIGRQSMIARNLMLKTGVEFGWAFVPFNFFAETQDQWSAQEYSGYNVHRALFGHYLFNFNVAIGYTPF